jgi:hypothetical protein
VLTKQQMLAALDGLIDEGNRLRSVFLKDLLACGQILRPVFAGVGRFPWLGAERCLHAHSPHGQHHAQKFLGRSAGSFAEAT